MDRRRFVLTILAGVVVASAAVQAQERKVARIGVLVAGPPPGEHACVVALRRGLADLGHVEGRTHLLEFRRTDVRPEEAFPRFAAELVRMGVDLIVSVTSLGILEAKQALATVPVVIAVGVYPVERGFIASLNRPGGNMTGIATFTAETYAKRLQIVAEALPGVSRVAVLRLSNLTNDFIVRDMRTAADQLGMKLQIIAVQRPEDFSAAFQAAVRGQAQAIVTTQGTFFVAHLREIVGLAAKHKLPSFSGEPGAAEAGMLVSHGASVTASCYRGAYYVDRILKGAKPAELPAEQPTKFDLTINLKTAKTLGLTIPPSLLLRADQVIE